MGRWNSASVGEHLKIKGIVTFPATVNCKPNETVVFSWVVFKSRAHRDSVNKKVTGDPRMNKIAPKTMPFDCNRMVYGGFQVMVDL